MCLGPLACGLEHAPNSTSHASETSSEHTSGGAGSSTTDTSTTAGPASDGESSGTSGTQTSSSTTGPAAVCGDGVVEGEEECDDPGDTACFKCIRDRLVFITSQDDFYGDFAMGLAEIDFRCNSLAKAAGLIVGNEWRFKAWISTSTESAADRLHHSPGRYVLRNGLVFAESWDALVAGHILNPLNVDENSQTQPNAAWTDTRPDGTTMPGSSHCDDWSSDDFELKAYIGNPSALDGNWTLYVGEATNPVHCQGGQSLYCFESP